MDIFTLQTSLINAFGDYLTDKVFARSSPPVQGKGERLFGFGVVQEALHSLHNHLAHQVLPEQLLVQILLQNWMERTPHQHRHGVPAPPASFPAGPAPTPGRPLHPQPPSCHPCNVPSTPPAPRGDIYLVYSHYFVTLVLSLHNRHKIK